MSSFPRFSYRYPVCGPLIVSFCLTSFADVPTVKSDPTQRVEVLIRQLGSSKFEERERATQELVRLGDGALPHLLMATMHSDREIARRAEKCVTAIVGSDAKLEPFIAELKINPDAQARAAAANKLMELRARARPAVPALVRALDDPDQHVRIRVLIALGHIGPAAGAAVPRLTQLLNDRKVERQVRWTAAVLALPNIGKPAASAVPELLRLLDDTDPHLKSGAAIALGVLGRQQRQVVPALLRVLDTKDGRVLGFAAEALGKLAEDPEQCVPALLQALQKTKGQSWASFDPRPGLVAGLGGFGPAAKPALSMLLEIAAAKNGPEPASLAAVRVLEKIDPAAKDALTELVRRDLRDWRLALLIEIAARSTPEK